MSGQLSYAFSINRLLAFIHKLANFISFILSLGGSTALWLFSVEVSRGGYDVGNDVHMLEYGFPSCAHKSRQQFY